MPVEIARVADDRAARYLQQAQREALSTLWGFHVVWHEQTHEVAAIDGEVVCGAGRIRVAASLAHIEAVVVDPARRRQGFGRRMLLALEEIANYYNCHKMTAEVPHGAGAHVFFERCGYKEEAVLPQHTWKRDVAVIRKFLL